MDDLHLAIEAAKAGYQFRRGSGNRLVLSAPRPQAVVAFEKSDEDTEAPQELQKRLLLRAYPDRFLLDLPFLP